MDLRIPPEFQDNLFGNYFVIGKGFIWKLPEIKNPLSTYLDFRFDAVAKRWISSGHSKSVAEWIQERATAFCNASWAARQRGFNFVVGKGDVQAQTKEQFGESAWAAVRDAALDLLEAGKQDGKINPKQELGYLGAIALLADSRSRPSDRRNAVELLLKLESVLDLKVAQEGNEEEQKGTMELIEALSRRDDDDES